MPRRRTPPDIARELPKLDAEARTFLKRQKLPAWIGLYKPRTIVWQRRETFVDAARRGQPPTHEGQRPLFSAIIDDPERLDPAARYIMQLWMAKHRERLAKREMERAAEPEAKRAAEQAVKAAQTLWAHLLAHPPSRDGRARNLADHNATMQAELAPLIERCKAEAARMKAANSRLSNYAAGKRLKEALDLKQSVRTIRRWLQE